MAHGSAIEADLLRYYGVDLRWLVDGRLSWRRFSVLLANLPADSATAQAMHGELAHWQTAEYLMANVVDLLRLSVWQRSGGKGERPKPIPRPGVADESTKRKRFKARRTFKPSDLSAMFGGVEAKVPATDQPEQPPAG